jgi:hypothetical protein
MENPDFFPGFLLSDVEGNVLPQLNLLREFGFYTQTEKQKIRAPKVVEHTPHG